MVSIVSAHFYKSDIFDWIFAYNYNSKIPTFTCFLVLIITSNIFNDTHAYVKKLHLVLFIKREVANGGRHRGLIFLHIHFRKHIRLLVKCFKFVRGMLSLTRGSRRDRAETEVLAGATGDTLIWQGATHLLRVNRAANFSVNLLIIFERNIILRDINRTICAILNICMCTCLFSP